MKLYLPIFVILFGLLNCHSTREPFTAEWPSGAGVTAYYTPSFNFFSSKYSLDQPDGTFTLPEELVEISGLSLSPHQTLLCAVQDEEGKIFFMDKESGELKEEIKFWKEGDYEGVEVVGDDVYVVKSTGTIYEVNKIGATDQKVTKYNSFLGKKNDVEGLCYDATQHRLLLACKGTPATGESMKDMRFKKVIYSFDLKTKLLDSLPAFTIELNHCQYYLEKQGTTLANREKLEELFSPESSDINFNPSAIAIHPFSGNIYMTSSVGKVMMILSPEGKLLYLEKMDKKIHKQPEGLTFDADGTLYVSNEGKKGVAMIHYFKMKE